ncbi:MAG: hypothetical protein RLZZ292_3207 [Bacteroidota bacterium]
MPLLQRFPNYVQTESMDCGPSCIRIVAKYYGKTFDILELRKISENTREGTSLLGLSRAAEAIGFRTLGIKTNLVTLLEENVLPCIAHWNNGHFVVLYKITKKRIYVSDPAIGLIDYSHKEFLRGWIGNNVDEYTEDGILLVIEPSATFFDDPMEEDINASDEQKERNKKLQRKGLTFFYQYLRPYRRFLVQMALGLLAGSLIQLILPFLTSSVVDIGIQNKNIEFVYLILTAQLAINIGSAVLGVIQSWISVHMNTRIGIALISDFIIKLMKLPISYFDTKKTGDVLQRISDHRRIQGLLTGTTLSTIFSFFNLILYSILLGTFNSTILMIVVISNTAQFLWLFFFLKRRERLDYKNFSITSRENNQIIEMIYGMQEIKLNNSERYKRWGWESLQAKLFKVSIESRTLGQVQGVGNMLISSVTSTLISIISAKLVIDGELSLGMMVSINYIIGQVSAPLSQLVGLVNVIQDAKISLNRINDIYLYGEEEQENQITELDAEQSIHLNNVSFRYPGNEKMIFEGLSLTIPNNQTTAIVGASGSGKTTLLKLLLRFYEPLSGDIKIGRQNFKMVSPAYWRSISGAVMQEGYIFSDTIANNIAVAQERIDKKRLKNAVTVANIKDFIEELPLGYNTKIGQEGVSLSTGQKQRLLIARIIYKNPSFIFFDEATSALDANNEKVIIENLNTFFQNKTVLVIAHRLSTVRNANKIVVLDNGKIVEEGNHEQLIAQRGAYYNLVKNQLELGN